MEGEEERDDCCCCMDCRPQVFTSVLLGILACVLVTGGVFLAFHKWDHTWLLVSAVGVVLIIIGTALHCCDSSESSSQRNGSQKSRPHVIPCGLDNGTLTEQLLPLSNARSVSQLSLNMVPAYFPTYGIEQHAAVVQNINHIAQGTGKSFLLLPIPGNANPVQLQNLMATVCQLDASASVEDLSSVRDPGVTDMSSQSTESSSSTRDANPASSSVPSTSTIPLSSTSSSSSIRIVKHAEVQTCDDDWSGVSDPDIPTTSDETRTCDADTVPVAIDTQCQTDLLEEAEVNNISEPSERNQEPRNSEEASSSAEDCISVSVIEREAIADSCAPTEVSPQPIYDVPVTIMQESLQNRPSTLQEESLPSVPPYEDLIVEEVAGDLLVDIAVVNMEPSQSVIDSNYQLMSDALLQPPTVLNSEQILLDIESPNSAEESSDPALADVEEDIESIERSSPPPSYDDVTQEENQTTIGAFGLAYGTI